MLANSSPPLSELGEAVREDSVDERVFRPRMYGISANPV